uniref:Fibronectin type-III domain-containing protein n=1 Tax=Latimeria chalumnae TaxID=7897 RepID=H3AW18_LATCH
VLTGWSFITTSSCCFFCLKHHAYAGSSASWDGCSTLILNSSLVRLGSPVRASCNLNVSCFQGSGVTASDVIWKLDKEDVPKSQSFSSPDGVSYVTLPNFNLTLGNLSCHIFHQGALRFLKWSLVKGGLPPSQPEHLSCATSQTEYYNGTINCSWTRSTETHIPTQFTLLVTEFTRLSTGNCTTSNEKNSCLVYLPILTVFFKITVTAENELGRAESQSLCGSGTELSKYLAVFSFLMSEILNPSSEWEWSPYIMQSSFILRGYNLERMWDVIRVKQVPGRSDCLQVQWETPHEVNYKTYQMMIQYHTGMEEPWTQVGLRSLVVPTRGPALWGKIEDMEGSGRRKVVIMWKPLGKNEANGKILGYRAYCLCKGKKEDIPQCHNNLSTDCRLDITKEKCSVFLSAYNSVGESPQSKIVFPPANQAALPPSLNVNASPAGDDSLLIKWESPSLPTTGHIIEWCQVSDKSDRVINWHFQPGNSSQGVIKENIEPARLYNISVHVLYNGEVVTQGYTQSYSKQSAPLSGPEVKPKQIWNWKAEVEWDEIQIDDRCGFIRNYTIFCGDKEGRFKSVSVNSSVYRYNISGLTENSIYQIFIMASTDGGSTNGSILTLKTKPIERENKMLVILLFTGITLIIITSVLTCIYQKQFFKKYLWPKVPSPAESTLAGWIP